MILKRQDLLGEQGSYLTEEALASLAASDVLRALDPSTLRPSTYFNIDQPKSPDAPIAPVLPNAVSVSPTPPQKAEVEMTTTIAPQPVFATPTTPAQNPAQNMTSPNIFSTAFAPAQTVAQLQPAPVATYQPQAPQQQAAPTAQPRLQTMRAPAGDGRRLEVGPDISLNGEISTCDILMVRGNVQAVLKDCRQIEIAAEGFFKGNAEIDDAIISGQYEGHLVVRGRLYITASGRVNGSIRYGSLQIDPGAEINGDVQSLTAAAQRPATPPQAPQNQNRNTANQSRGSGTFSNLYGNAAAGSF
jgi:cytoskeletal protein CcmA (bactofilin family)